MRTNTETENGYLTHVALTNEACRDELNKIYGPDGFYIHHFDKVYKGGFLGFHQHVLSKAYYMKKTRPQAAVETVQKPASLRVTNSYSSQTPSSYSASNDFEAKRSEFLKDLDFNQLILKHIANIESDVQGIKKNQSNIVPSDQKEHESIGKIRDILEENYFSKKTVEDILFRLKENFPVNALDDFEKVRVQVLKWLKESIKIYNPPAKKEGKMLTEIFVGPTGVGKTTSIPRFVSRHLQYAKDNKIPGYNKKIYIVTTDNMRVGAEEQIKNWSKALSVEYSKAESNEEFCNIYNKVSANYDYLYVDTGGYSPNDATHIGELHDIVTSRSVEANIYLTLKAATGYMDIKNIMKNYSIFNYKGLIVTKWDETSCFGPLLSMLYETHVPVAYVTFGQNPLNSMLEADPIWILKNLSGFEKNDFIEL